MGDHCGVCSYVSLGSQTQEGLRLSARAFDCVRPDHPRKVAQRLPIFLLRSVDGLLANSAHRRAATDITRYRSAGGAICRLIRVIRCSILTGGWLQQTCSWTTAENYKTGRN